MAGFMVLIVRNGKAGKLSIIMELVQAEIIYMFRQQPAAGHLPGELKMCSL